MINEITLAFQKGGLWMWAILFFQIASIVIIAERVWFLFFNRKLDQTQYTEKFSFLIRKGRLVDVIEKVEEQEESLAPVIQSACQTALDCGGREEIQDKMDEALMGEMLLSKQRG